MNRSCSVLGACAFPNCDCPLRPESETPEVDALFEEFINAGGEKDVIDYHAIMRKLDLLARSIERRLSLAQTEIKGHMRVIDELKAGMVTCNECAFRYGAEHKLADGTHSCPVCELAQAQARIAELEKDAARLDAIQERRLTINVSRAGDFFVHGDLCGDEALRHGDVRAAIDAALKDRA